MILQRGEGGTRVTKVRGHATSAMVDSGDVRLQYMLGNDAADAAVERVTVHTGQVDLPWRPCMRRDTSCTWLSPHAYRISCWTSVHARGRSVRACLPASCRAPEVLAIHRPSEGLFAPAPHLARRVRRCSSGLGCRQAEGGGWIASIPGYLEALEWVEREPQHAEEGISWLELLVDFEQCTGATVRTAEGSLLDASRLLRREPSAKAIVRIFQAEVLRNVEVLFTRDVSNIFKACRGGGAARSSLG